MKNIKTALALVTFLMTLVGSPAWAAGEGEIFTRLLGRIANQGSMTAGRYLLKNSVELRDLSRSLLGPEAAGVADDRLTEMAILKLKKQGDYRMAQNFERRLAIAEEDFLTAMTRDPMTDMDQLLARISSERFQANGQLRFKSASSMSRAEKELAQAFHADSDSEWMRRYVLSVAEASPQLKIAEKLATYDSMIEANPRLEQLFPKLKVYDRLADEEMIDFSENLAELMTKISKAPASLSTKRKVSYALRNTLRGKVPASTIPERVRAFMKGEPGSFERALGDMTLEETQLLFHGGNPLNPTRESLIGQYIKETGATTTIRTFDNASFAESVGGTPGAQGPLKLVVSVSEEAGAVFRRLFNRKEWMSVIGHANMVHEGTVTGYGGGAASPIRLTTNEYTPLPVVLLKSTEAQRMTQYMMLFRTKGGAFAGPASTPWDNMQGYCASSLWSGGCTQHIGNIPLGDKRVLEYTLPSKHINNDHSDIGGVIQRLKPYEHADPLVKRVWKVPGNQQFGEMIGQGAANLRGEMANPGWTIWTLLGPTAVERVPIVFVVRPNHKLPIDPAFRPEVEVRN